jgi:hypothetical protein
MKAIKVDKYLCSVCETAFDHTSNAERCEAVHARLLAIYKIGANVRWSSSCGDYGYYVYGQVVGFAGLGKLVIQQKNYDMQGSDRSIKDTAVLTLVDDDGKEIR